MIELRKGDTNTIKIQVTDRGTTLPVDLTGRVATWRLVSTIDVVGDSIILLQGYGVVSLSIVSMDLGILSGIEYGTYVLEVLFPLSPDFVYDPMRVVVKVLDDAPLPLNPLPILVNFEVLGSGAMGDDTVVAELDKEQFFLPSVLSGHVTDYSECFSTFTIFMNSVDDTDNWVITQIRSEGIEVMESVNSRTATIYNILDTASRASIKFVGTRAGYSDVIKEFFVTKLVNSQSIQIVIESTNGTAFRVTDGRYTKLIAHVYSGNTEITDQVPADNFKWERNSLDRVSDEYWNAMYAAGYKEIDLTVNDEDVIATYHVTISL